MTMTRRDFVKASLAGSSLFLLAPIVPGCSRPAVRPDKALAQGGAGSSIPEDFATLFNIDDALAHKILARAMANGGDFADLYFEHTMVKDLKLEEGIVNVASLGVGLGAGVRVVVGDQSGYAYTESLTEAALLEAAKTAALIAHGKAQGAAADFGAVKIESPYPVDFQPVEYPVDDAIGLLRRVDEAARAADADTKVVVAWHRASSTRMLIYRSDGRVMWDTRPRLALGCMTSIERKGRTERNWHAEGGAVNQEFMNGERPEAIAKEAIARTSLAFDAITPPAGEMPVVLGPGYSGILLHEAVGHGLEADFNRKGTSIYADRIGQKVASELCTVIDDGTIEHSQGSIAFDDEGEPAARTTLIENGILRGYMQDRISAKHFNVPTTGNGRRESYKHAPVPRMTNTLLLAGPHSKEEVFEGIERGIYAIDFTNGQVNIGPGDYTFFVNHGYMIEKGKITQPIKDVNIIGNGPQSLERVDRIAGDFWLPPSGTGYCGKAGQRVPVNYGVPHLRISKVTVGGREKA